MSRFVENLRSMLSRHFDIRDESTGEQVVSVWRTLGLDLSRERDLTVHVLLPSEAAADELAFRAEGLPAFIGSEIREVAAQNGLAIELAATFRMLPAAEMLDTLERLICAMGSDLGAVTDGWSAGQLATDTARAA